MANIILRCFCAAFFLVSTLSAFAAGKLLAPGDTFYKDIKGANVSKVSNTGATAGSTGIAKTQKVEIYVKHRTPNPPPPHSNAWHSGTVKTTFASRLNWKLPSVKTAVKFGLKAGKTNLYLLAGTTALAYVLDEMGWFDDDGVLSYRPDPNSPDVTVVPFENAFTSSHDSLLYESPLAACAVTAGCEQYGACNPTIRSFDADKQLALGWCYSTDPENGYGSWWQVKACPHNTVIVDKGCALLDAEPRRVTDSMIEALDLDGYTPTEVDIPIISPYLGDPDETIITEQPKPIVLPTDTTTTQNPDGSTTTTATDTTVNVTINTTNQGDMYVTTTDTTTTTTYQDGTQTSKTIDTKTTDYKDSTQKTDDNDDTKQDIKVELPDIPTDCDLVPTLCDTQQKIIDQDKNFYDWMRQPFDNSNQLDLPTAKDRDYTRKYPINIGDGQCPTPMELQTILAGNVSVSFEPFCQFASILRYLVLTGASIFAAYILLGVVRRG